MGSHREKLVRAFFGLHSLELPVETPLPVPFLPNLPVYQRYQILPISSDVDEITLIVSAFLREVVGLDDNSMLGFSYSGTTIRSKNGLTAFLTCPNWKRSKLPRTPLQPPKILQEGGHSRMDF